MRVHRAYRVLAGNYWLRFASFGWVAVSAEEYVEHCADPVPGVEQCEDNYMVRTVVLLLGLPLSACLVARVFL